MCQISFGKDNKIPSSSDNMVIILRAGHTENRLSSPSGVEDFPCGHRNRNISGDFSLE
jgi:hypothetical protein